MIFDETGLPLVAVTSTLPTMARMGPPTADDLVVETHWDDRVAVARDAWLEGRHDDARGILAAL